MFKQKKVIVWVNGIDNLILENGNVGGLTVQMYFWSLIFIKNNWTVYSFSEVKKNILRDIHFLKFPTIRYVGFFIELIFSFFYLLYIRPDLIIIRGAGRGLAYLSIYSKILNIKMVHFGASNSDYEIGKELIVAKHDKRLYRFGLKRCVYFVVQNNIQEELIKQNYNTTSNIIIPNIWFEEEQKFIKKEQKYILWISNFRNFKRPEWFIELATYFPDESFIMVGADLDKELYAYCKARCETINNIEFKGSLSLNEVNKLFQVSKLFVCTSEIEGFPNTFLQAWANAIPVLSTFDPSNVIEKNKLGVYCVDFDSLKIGLINILSDDKQKNELTINNYFDKNHSPQKHFLRLMKYIHS